MLISTSASSISLLKSMLILDRAGFGHMQTSVLHSSRYMTCGVEHLIPSIPRTLQLSSILERLNSFSMVRALQKARSSKIQSQSVMLRMMKSLRCMICHSFSKRKVLMVEEPPEQRASLEWLLVTRVLGHSSLNASTSKELSNIQTLPFFKALALMYRAS